ncbi:MAG: hypothetical protein RET84_11245 [Pseudomonadota bacterium]|nr:hypothetical protein [Pseudomonadota bacterium]
MEEAWRKSEEIDRWASYDGMAAHISRSMGIDLGGLDPGMTVEQSNMSGVQGRRSAHAARVHSQRRVRP